MALPIFTERLAMRAYEPGDLRRLHEVLYSDEQSMSLLGGPRDLAGTRFALERSMNQQQLSGFSFWPVFERSSGLLIGEAGLFPLSPDGPDVALGYAFGSPWWGRGYATEAAGGVILEAFGDIGLDRLVAITREANLGSRHVLEKLGFVLEGVRHVWGAEQMFFTLERDAWELRQAPAAAS